MHKAESAVVLLSAGLDSTYNLIKAREKFDLRAAITFNYGQVAAEREVKRAAALAARYEVPHKVLALPWFRDFTRSALVERGQKIPTGKDVSIDDRAQSEKTAKAVWVPNRNGILLNIAAAFAEGLGADFVIPGFNLEEAQTFPDNTGDFLKALDTCWSFSTANHVKGFCFSTQMTKSEIVADGIANALPFADLWPCYLSQYTWCGQCESCQRFKRAVEANGLSFEKLRAS